MVTKYDVFAVICKRIGPSKPQDIFRELQQRTNYDNIFHHLSLLQKENVITKTKYGYQKKRTEKSTLLKNLILYCTHKGISYNLFLQKEFLSFMSKALSSGVITSKTNGLNPRTLQNYIQTLNKTGLLLIISRKPLKAVLFYNSLIKNLFKYFDIKLKIKAKRINYINEIKKELKKFEKLRDQNVTGYQKIVDDLEISFVHHSLSLEGNPITLPATYQIIRNNIVPEKQSLESVDEVKNYQKAIVRMLTESTQKIPLTVESILTYHSIAMAHKEFAGKIRSEEVIIKGKPNFKIVKSKDINERLSQLFIKYNEFLFTRNTTVGDSIKFAAYFHNEFQQIHPFLDGNSRITRLLTFYVLHSQNIPILDIPFGLLDEYMNNTKNSLKRDDKSMFEHLQKILLHNLKLINSKL